jgi:hypothetical protein
LSVSVSAGSHGDRVAGVHAHRIDVLDGADDDAVVRLVAHHLHLKLFPSQHRFFDQHFGGRRGVEPALDDLDEFGLVIGNAAAGAAKRERGADDGGQADNLQCFQRFDQRFLLIALAALRLFGAPVARSNSALALAICSESVPRLRSVRCWRGISACRHS